MSVLPILAPFFLRRLCAVLTSPFDSTIYQTLSLVCKSFCRHLRATCREITISGPYEDKVVWPCAQQAHFCRNFSYPFSASRLPRTLKCLVLNVSLEQEFNISGLPNLQTLILRLKSKVILDPKVLPASLKYLELGETIISAAKIKELPDLREISFNNFNEPIIAADLPRSLQKISFGDKFNQPILEKDLPSQLQGLSFGSNFAQDLDIKKLPRSLRVLRLVTKFSQNIDISGLPSGLRSLTLPERSTFRLPLWRLPTNLRVLSLGSTDLRGEISQLPSSLTNLVFPANYTLSIEAKDLPPKLVILTLPTKVPHKIKCQELPRTLRRLSGNIVSEDLFNLPFSLTQLGFTNQACPLVLAELPRRIAFLDLPSEHEVFSLSDLPPGLRILNLGRSFNSPLELTHLPSSVRKVGMGFSFSQFFKWETVPATLRELVFGPSFLHPVDVNLMKKINCRVFVHPSHPDFHVLTG